VENLQYLTRSENVSKKPKLKGCASIYIGVQKNGDRWQASATDKKRVYLGTFDTQEEAGLARDAFYRAKGRLVAFNF
jgi:hypothetical protein